MRAIEKNILDRVLAAALVIAALATIAVFLSRAAQAAPAVAAAHAPVAASPAAAPAAGSDAASERVARGAYLVRIMVCNDCHTPMKMGAKGPEPDLSRLLSGHPSSIPVPPAPALPAGLWGWSGASTMTAFAGPWGVSFTANLTPDPETGLGKWTEAQFVEALRTGRHLGKGRPILPPMPWEQFRHATDEDLKAIFAYLRSIPAIQNKVPTPIDPPEPPAQTSETGSPSEPHAELETGAERGR